MVVGGTKPTGASVAPGFAKGVLTEDVCLDRLGLSINK